VTPSAAPPDAENTISNVRETRSGWSLWQWLLFLLICGIAAVTGYALASGTVPLLYAVQNFY
jgi:hypothetical protein